MSLDYAAIAADVALVLAEVGRPTTFARAVPTAIYDPTTGDVVTTPRVFPIAAAVFAYDEKLIDGTSVLSGDLRAYCNPLAERPVAGDILAWGGASLRVIASKPLAPAGTNVLTELQLRG